MRAVTDTKSTLQLHNFSVQSYSLGPPGIFLGVASTFWGSRDHYIETGERKSSRIPERGPRL